MAAGEPSVTGRLKLPLEDARDIVENDPMFRIPRSR
jgi:hypothetical protein